MKKHKPPFLPRDAHGEHGRLRSIHLRFPLLPMTPPRQSTPFPRFFPSTSTSLHETQSQSLLLARPCFPPIQNQCKLWRSNPPGSKSYYRLVASGQQSLLCQLICLPSNNPTKSCGKKLRGNKKMRVWGKTSCSRRGLHQLWLGLRRRG